VDLSGLIAATLAEARTRGDHAASTGLPHHEARMMSGSRATTFGRADHALARRAPTAQVAKTVAAAPPPRSGPTPSRCRDERVHPLLEVDARRSGHTEVYSNLLDLSSRMSATTSRAAALRAERAADEEIAASTSSSGAGWCRARDAGAG